MICKKNIILLFVKEIQTWIYQIAFKRRIFTAGVFYRTSPNPDIWYLIINFLIEFNKFKFYYNKKRNVKINKINLLNFAKIYKSININNKYTE